MFCDKWSQKEDITVAYAEHLLRKVAPGKSYIIDDEAEKKGLKCKCGCNVDPNLGSTGIGMIKFFIYKKRNKVTYLFARCVQGHK